MTRCSPGTLSILLLAVAIVGVSAAGALFALIKQVPPLLRASWRLWATSWMQLAPAAAQWRALESSERQAVSAPRSLALMALSGAFLAVHFGAWVWSIDHTSLTHSLLWVTAHPIVMALFPWAVFAHEHCRDARSRRARPGPAVAAPTDLGAGHAPGPNRPSLLATAGAAVGFGGGALMLLGVEETDGVTLAGDAAAFLGAVAMAVYLVVGATVRKHTPVFVYAFSVTCAAAALLTLASLASENTRLWGGGASSAAFGWLSDARLAAYVIALAAASGICGHTVLNFVLKTLPALAVSVALLLEPLVGSIIGVAVGVQAFPNAWTWVGGGVLLVGAAMVTVAQGRRKVPSGDHEEAGVEVMKPPPASISGGAGGAAA